MINEVSFWIGYIIGAVGVIGICLLNHIDNGTKKRKKIIKAVEEEIKDLNKLSDEDFYYKYFNMIEEIMVKPTSASLNVEREFHSGTYYQIILSGSLFSVSRSVEFDAKYYTKDDLKKIIDRARKENKMKLKLVTMDGTVEYIEYDHIINSGLEEKIRLIGEDLSYYYSDLISAELDGEIIYKWDCFKIEDKVNVIYDNLAALSEKILNAEDTQKDYYLKEIVSCFKNKIVENDFPKEFWTLFFAMDAAIPFFILDILDYVVYCSFYRHKMSVSEIAKNLDRSVESINDRLFFINSQFENKFKMMNKVFSKGEENECTGSN